jgi:hypothetical protein
MVAAHGAERGRKAYITRGCGVVPQGGRLRRCYYCPSAMQNSARYLPPWLGNTSAPLGSTCHSNPLQSVPSTPFTTPHVTHGTDEGLDLWVAEVFSNQDTCCCPTDGSGRMNSMDAGSRTKPDSLMFAH